jgi:hypothetical protein
MNERRNDSGHKGQQKVMAEADSAELGSIGSGKRLGLYGCGLLLLGLVIIAIIIVFTGLYVPFEGTEGVGP